MTGGRGYTDCLHWLRPPSRPCRLPGYQRLPNAAWVTPDWLPGIDKHAPNPGFPGLDAQYLTPTPTTLILWDLVAAGQKILAAPMAWDISLPPTSPHLPLPAMWMTYSWKQEVGMGRGWLGSGRACGWDPLGAQLEQPNMGQVTSLWGEERVADLPVRGG